MTQLKTEMCCALLTVMMLFGGIYAVGWSAAAHGRSAPTQIALLHGGFDN